MSTICVYEQKDRPILEEVYAVLTAEFAAFEQGVAA